LVEMNLQRDKPASELLHEAIIKADPRAHQEIVKRPNDPSTNG
jgi:hypothetical protein